MLPEIWMGQTEFFVILDHFCPLTPKNPENQNFENIEKTQGDIILLRMCTINEDHMMYGSRDMERNGQNFLSSWAIFCRFTPTNYKIKILKK